MRSPVKILRKRSSRSSRHRSGRSRKTVSRPRFDGSRTPLIPDLGVRFLLLFPWVFLTALFGGARSWLWEGTAGLFVLLLAVRRARRPLFPDEASGSVVNDLRPLWIGAAVLAGVVLLQLLPLPGMLIRVLSPTRAHWLRVMHDLDLNAPTTLSYIPLQTGFHLMWWGFLAVYGGLLYHAVTRSRHSYPNWLFIALFLVAASEAVYGILQVLVPSGVLWDTQKATGLAYRGYARGTFINRNHFAAFLGLLWPVLFAYILIIRSPRKLERVLAKRERAQILMQKKAFAVFCLGIVVLALVFSQSRGGILSALLAFSILCAFIASRHRRLVLVLAACWTIMIGYGFVIGFEGIVERFSRIEQGAAGRLDIWKDGWHAALDHPWTGTGLGTYPWVSRVYQQAFGPERRASHAHNDYLEAVVELGFPAAVFLACGVWTLWGRQAYRLWRNRRTLEPDRLMMSAATLAALGGYLLHAWVEFNNAIPANQLTAVLVAVLHFAFYRHGFSRSTRSRSSP